MHPYPLIAYVIIIKSLTHELKTYYFFQQLTNLLGNYLLLSKFINHSFYYYKDLVAVDAKNADNGKLVVVAYGY